MEPATYTHPADKFQILRRMPSKFCGAFENVDLTETEEGRKLAKDCQKVIRSVLNRFREEEHGFREIPLDEVLPTSITGLSLPDYVRDIHMVDYPEENFLFTNNETDDHLITYYVFGDPKGDERSVFVPFPCGAFAHYRF